MSLIKLLPIIFLSSCFGFYSLAQNEEDSLSTQDDSDCVSDSEDWTDFDFDWEFEAKEFELRGSPTIALGFGQARISLDNFNSGFSNPNYPELKLGYTSIHESKYSDDVLRYRFNHIFLGNSFTKTNSSNSASKDIRTDMWRFGFGWASGYGYDLGKSSIIPYHSTSMAWSRVQFKDALQNPTDAAFAQRFDEAFRFGTGAEAGVRFKIIPLVSLDVSYERSIIFERHLFWKWAGSGIIEAAAQGMLDHFVGKIGKSSPAALPIVSVILKSALSYGIYELRQEKMNWPFNSAAPLAYDQFKVGMTFNF
jgi:hypothetical protein